MSDDDDGTIEFKKPKEKKVIANENKSLPDYGLLLADAHRGIVRSVIQTMIDNPMDSYYNIYITFDTNHPDVDIPIWVREQYDAELTVVMNHQYSNLEVNKDWFSVTLYFNGKPAPLLIPFESIMAFHDKNAEFTIGFGAMPAQGGMIKHVEGSEDDINARDIVEALEEVESSAEVISFDDFRKRD